jgi:hypothetical protein
MTDTTVTTESPASASPFEQPARDNAGNVTPPLAAHARAGLIADSAYDGLPPDQQSRYARMPKAGDQGGAEWIARDQVAVDSGIKPGATTDGVPPAVGDRVKVGEMEVSQQELQEFFQSKADTELRKASLPVSPADYKAELPADFKPPPGIDVKIDTTAPEYADAAKWAHAKGFSQQEFSEMLSLHASLMARQEATYENARQAEIAKMGANGTSRVTALETWLRGMVGDDIAGQMRQVMATEKIVRGYEIMQRKWMTQGAASPQAGRQAPEQEGRVSEEQWQGMSPAERMNYTNNTDQSQFRR